MEKRHLEIDGVAENHCVHTANVEATPFRFTRNNIEGKFHRKMSFHEFWIKILREREAISLYPRSTRNPRVAERERKREREIICYEIHAGQHYSTRCKVLGRKISRSSKLRLRNDSPQNGEWYKLLTEFQSCRSLSRREPLESSQISKKRQRLRNERRKEKSWKRIRADKGEWIH